MNVQALTQVQPKELDASEIEVRIGATWVKPEYIEDFMRDTFETPQHLLNRNVMGIQFSGVTGQWNVKGKNADYGNSLEHDLRNEPQERLPDFGGFAEFKGQPGI